MTSRPPGRLRPNLLCIAPPYSVNSPPAGAAALLGYLKAMGCHDFDFLDLRLGVPESYAPTYAHTGVFGDSYVMDVPDLPLVLRLLRAVEEGGPLIAEPDELFERYCLDRGIAPSYLQGYLLGLDGYFEAAFGRLRAVQFVGFSVWTSNYLTTLLAAAHLKRRHRSVAVVAGGPQVTESEASAVLALRAGLFDAVAVGEGEETLLGLYTASHRAGGGPLGPVPGTRRLDPVSGRVETTPRALLSLDRLPLPSFEEMVLPAYQPRFRPHRTVPYQLSRGCTDKCTFCSEWVFWRHFRTDVPEHALDQVQELIARYGTEALAFSDSLLNGHMPRLRAFAEGLLSRGIQVRWGGFMRAQIDPDTARLLKQAGCDEVFVGVESLSDRTLELMNKRRTSADNLLALEAFLSAGIKVAAGFIPGFPGDSRRGFMRTAMLLRELQLRFPNRLRVNVEPFIVSPGQPLFKDLASNGLVPVPWDDVYLDIAPRYRDVTEALYCRVDGDNQGVERMGRLRIAATVTQDTQAPETDIFAYRGVESVSTHDVRFEHVHADWYLACRKSAQAVVHALLVQQQERDTFQAARAENPLVSLEAEPFAGMFAEIAGRHVLTAHRPGELRRTLYRRELLDGAALAVSPFVIARKGGGADERQQLLVVDFVTGRWYRRRLAEAELYTFLLEPRTEAELWEYARDHGLAGDRTRWRVVLGALKEMGILVVCDVPDGPSRMPTDLRTGVTGSVTP